MRHLLFVMLALLTLAPLAAAQDDASQDNATRPDDAAWVEDCPPDMMCAANTAEDEPRPYGDESCIECSGPAPDAPADDGANCMDGQQEGETCRDDASCDASSSSAEACGDDVQYLDGRGPADCENCRGDDADDVVQPAEGGGAEGGITSVQDDASEKNDVPAAGLGVILAAFGVAIALVARKL